MKSIRPNVPDELQQIVSHCLKKEPEQRYANARLLADDLRRGSFGFIDVSGARMTGDTPVNSVLSRLSASKSVRVRRFDVPAPWLTPPARLAPGGRGDLAAGCGAGLRLVRARGALGVLQSGDHPGVLAGASELTRRASGGLS